MFRDLRLRLPRFWRPTRRPPTGYTGFQAPGGLNGYWASEPHSIADCLGSGPDGLSQVEADRRLRSIGPNRLRNHRTRSRLEVLWAQLRNPLLLILVFAACASASTGECIDATIVLAVVVASVGIGYSPEYSAQTAVAALQAQVQTRTNVVRDGRTALIPIEEVVPGDVVLLSAGTLIPGDGIHTSRLRKVGEIPFDFVRKRVSVIVEDDSGRRLITKGAFERVVDACSRLVGGPLDAVARASLTARYEAWTGKGIRVLAVAERALDPESTFQRDDERDLTFVGFLTFLDRPKPGASDTIDALGRLGVAVKLITGDSKRVAQHIASLVGLPHDRVLTGGEMLALHEEALWHAAERTDLFAEVDPNQKERIILALKKMGHVVGFLGDGVNDAPAMHEADTSLSVDDAVDVAREAADFVLLERNLDVIQKGVVQSRRRCASMTGSAWGFFPVGRNESTGAARTSPEKRATARGNRPSWSVRLLPNAALSRHARSRRCGTARIRIPQFSPQAMRTLIFTRGSRRNSRKCPA